MKNICILQNYSTPYRKDLYKELSKKYNLTVVYMQRAKDEGRLWSVNETEGSYNVINLENFKCGKFIINKQIKHILKANKFDVVIAIENLPNIVSVLYSSYYIKKIRGKFILWTGEFRWHHYLRRKFSKFIYEYFSNCYRRSLYKRADAFIAYGIESKKFLMEYGIESKYIFSGSQSICVGRENYMYEINKKLTEDKNMKENLVFTTMAYLRKDKGIDRLIEVFNRVCKDSKDITLNIIGDGEYRDILEQKAGESINFLGYLEGDKKYRELLKSDIFIFPTLKDSWGLVVNEAMEFGNAVICSDKAACADELVNKNGFKYNPYNYDELERIIRYLIDNRNIVSNMSKLSVDIIKEYSIEKIANNFDDAIKMCIGRVEHE